MAPMKASFRATALVLAGVFFAIFSVEFLAEWWRLGMPSAGEMSWADVNNAKLVDVLSPMARGYNNILAMLIATIGLAIPLTANMHTPKLIDMFFRDRVNQLVLVFMAFGAANVLWVDYIIGPKFAPVWAFRVAVWGALAGWAILVPYFFYVVRFLDPSNILGRLHDETTGIVDDVASGKLGTEEGQAAAHERLYQMGTIILKALDRADRSVALEGLWAVKRTLDHHGTHKPTMPAAWFKVDRGDFVGLSSDAIDLLNEDKSWFEMKAMTQMFLAYQHALSKTADVVSSVSDANRVIAVAAAARGDDKVVELSLRYFNNFLREAIKRKDVHAVYDVFYQYRLLAHDLRARPDTLRSIARGFHYYGDVARSAGLDFVEDMAAFDLGFVVRRAYDEKSPMARAVLDEELAISHVRKGVVAPLIVKAKLILGAYFLQTGRAAEAALVRADLAGVAPDALASAERGLLAAERSFFEVTARQVNFEYVAPERREHLQAFVRSLAPAAA